MRRTQKRAERPAEPTRDEHLANLERGIKAATGDPDTRARLREWCHALAGLPVSNPVPELGVAA